MDEITTQILIVIISAFVAVVATEVLRRRNFQGQKRLEALYNLMAYRHQVDSSEFLSSLNATRLLFSKDKSLKKLLDDLYDAYSNNNVQSAKLLVVAVIKRVCNLQGFDDITEKDIDNVFVKSPE